MRIGYRRAPLLLIGAATMLALADGASGQAVRAWKHFPLPSSAPAGAPNVLLIMTDDVGFSSSSTFGGAIPTPTFDALARSGLRYNEFHTTAMCSPSRAALLTGRNHHAVASGSIADVAIDEPGYTSVIPDSAATVARVLRDNGYDTAFLGKNHNTPLWETGPTGPFKRWPIGWGFNYFYGFNGAASDQFAPSLVENINQAEPSKDPGYILDRDLADHLIHWLQIQHNLRPDHPFFAYLAPGTMHSPHQALPEWIARFRGKFDMGWDKLREQTFERQKRMGVIPADARLAPRPPGLPAWDSLSPAMQRIYAHQMEAAAAQLAYCDSQIGRIIGALREAGELDNTLVIFIQGDNGASMDSQFGSNLELTSLMGIDTSEADLLKEGTATHGGPHSYANYTAAWAYANNTPFPWGKQVASHLGGLRDGLVISWPARIKHAGEMRTQFHHLIDIAPTIYEAAHITPPEMVDGVRQQPIDGASMVYTFDHPDAPSHHREQYFEMLGNHAFYKDSWIASTTPGRAPWDRSRTPIDPNGFKWELYDLNSDYSQTVDLAAKNPARLAELKADFAAAAVRYNVNPLTADLIGRVAPGNRPSLLAARTHLIFYAGDTRYTPGTFGSLGIGWTMTARITVADAGAEGPVVVQGDEFGGSGLMLDKGLPLLVYNPTGRPQERFALRGEQAISPGAHELSLRAEALPQQGPRAARIVMSLDGKDVASRDVAVFYPTRGQGVVGRYNVKPLTPDAAEPAPHGYTVESVSFDLPARIGSAG